jgi:hypothetical protein
LRGSLRVHVAEAAVPSASVEFAELELLGWAAGLELLGLEPGLLEAPPRSGSGRCIPSAGEFAELELLELELLELEAAGAAGGSSTGGSEVRVRQVPSGPFTDDGSRAQPPSALR